MRLSRKKLAGYIPENKDIESYIDLFFSRDELLLAQILSDGPLSEEEIKDQYGKDPKALIWRAYQREMINKVLGDDGILRYELTSVKAVINNTAVFDREVWESIPEEGRKLLYDWSYRLCLDETRSMTPEKRKARPVQKILPLKQIKEYLKSCGTEFRVIPCDCHSRWGDAGYDKRVCICTDDGINTHFDRQLGETKSLEETLELLDQTDNLGLVHTQEYKHICNCSIKYCFPMRAAFDLDTVGKCPEVSYIVQFDESKCLKCGLCLKRCQFGVFSFKNGAVRLDKKKCWGCGVCVAKCPGKALKVRKRPVRKK